MLVASEDSILDHNARFAKGKMVLKIYGTAYPQLHEVVIISGKTLSTKLGSSFSSRPSMYNIVRGAEERG